MDYIDDIQKQFANALDCYRAVEALFDHVADTVYFLKDRSGRYMSVNQTLVDRCSCASKSELIGNFANEIFPGPMGILISEQDHRVVQTGRGIQSRLELHLYANHREGWCLTWKKPLRDRKGLVIGLSGVSRDVQRDTSAKSDFSKVSVVLDHVQNEFRNPLRTPDLARMSGMSSYQLERRVRELLGLTIGQYIMRERIEYACNRLRHSDDPISMIALDCGYADQAAFSRQFRQSVRLSPNEYRKRFVMGG